MSNGRSPGGGYFKVARKMFRARPEGCPFWNEKREYSRWEAWVDLIQLAAYEPHKVVIGSTAIQIERGETRPLSVRFLAARWGWGTKRARLYLQLVSDMGRVRAHQETREGHTYVVENYDTYQGEGHSEGTAATPKRAQRGHSKGTAGTTKYKEPSKGKEGEERACPARSASETGNEDVVVWIPIKGKVTQAATQLGPVRASDAGHEAGVTAEHLADWEERYPGIDVRGQLRKCQGWNVANPQRRKTPRGIARHVESWLSRAQDRARANGSGHGRAWRQRRELQAGGERAEPEEFDLQGRLDRLAAALPEDLPDTWAPSITLLGSECGGDMDAVESRLAGLEAELLEHVHSALGIGDSEALDERVEQALQRLGARLPAEEIARSREHLHRRLLREHLNLPVLSLFAPEAEGSA